MADTINAGNSVGAAWESVRAFVAWVGGAGTQIPGEAGVWGDARYWRHGPLTVAWWPRRPDGPREVMNLPLLVLGDDSECRVEGFDANVAAGVPIRFDAATGSLVLHTSIVGLPLIYGYLDGQVSVVASDIHLLRNAPGVQMRFDAKGVQELGEIGHPVGHRTLFQNLSLLPSGARCELRSDGSLSSADSWRLIPAPPLDWEELIERQVGAFVDAVRHLDVDRSFLSLTAGLDTRTVFAALVAEGRGIPAATMTGEKRSLDARAASRLCAAYGLSHYDIVLDERFTQDLPQLVETASRLSGGLSSLDQAPEVFMYRQLGDGFAARLSGNLGNQVGRGGTEGVSTRGADLGILSGHLTAPRVQGSASHWLIDELRLDARGRSEFILKNEVPFTLASNYPIGNHYAKQQTPYASRALIETLALRPVKASEKSHSRLAMRLRDLSHRFLGESADRSFQRKLLRDIGGYAARYPINWGWRASGGVSPTGVLWGGATLLGMLARARGLDGGVLRPLMDASGLPSLHDFRESRRWLRESLREFTYDTLKAERNRALFSADQLDTVLDAHYAGRRDHYTTITFALDVALARQTLDAVV